MSKWQWWPDFEQVCVTNMTCPKEAPEPQDAGENDNSLQLCSFAASTQTTPAIVQSPVLAREQTSATLCFKSNQNTIDIYSHISNT